MRKVYLILTAVLLGFCALAYNACGGSYFTMKVRGTEITNPFSVTHGATDLLNAICGTMVRCHSSLTLDHCRSGVMSAAGIASQLGLVQVSYPTYSSIIQAENTGEIVANLKATDSCFTAISALSCSDALVQKSYDATLKDPFSGVAYMIPTQQESCPVVFRDPPRVNEYYVSSTGSNSNDGSAAAPWATIDFASNYLVLGSKGAIVHVLPGTYTSTTGTTCPAGTCGILTNRSGTPEARITYVSDQQWGAKLSSAGYTNVWQNLGSYVDIVNFEIVGNSSTIWGLHNDGQNVHIIRNHVHDIPDAPCNAAGGIESGQFNSPDVVTVGNLVHNIGPQIADGLPSASYCATTYGIVSDNPRAQIYNNIVYSVSGYGIRTAGASTNVAISNNLIFGSGARSATAFLGGGIYIGATNGQSPHTGSTVSNNILRNNRGATLREISNIGSNAYLNNLVFNNGQGFIFLGGNTDVGTLNTNPQMLNFQLDGSGNYELTPASSAVNAGTTSCFTGTSVCSPEQDYLGFRRPYGSALDIGPYESHP